MGSVKTKNLFTSLLKALAICTMMAVYPASAGAQPLEAQEEAGDDNTDESTANCRRFGTCFARLVQVPRQLSEQNLEQILQFVEVGGSAKPEASGAILEQVLKQLSGADQPYLICELAISPRAESRLVLAHALSQGFMALGVPQARSLLETDADPRVRAILAPPDA